MENLQNTIRSLISQQVAALNRPDLFRQPLVAFAAATDERFQALKEIVGEWHLLPTELLPDAQSVVSYFVPFTREVVAEPKTVRDASPLWGEAYGVINPYFDGINAAVCAHLSALGHTTRTIQATHTYDPRDMKSMWSHRSAAVIAGLGSFGANGMVITGKGSGGRFCTVLTSAALHRGEPARDRDRCLRVKNGACGLCLKICPVQALSAGAVNKFACQDEINKNDARQRESSGRELDTCGKCISVCPVAYID